MNTPDSKTQISEHSIAFKPTTAIDILTTRTNSGSSSTVSTPSDSRANTEEQLARPSLVREFSDGASATQPPNSPALNEIGLLETEKGKFISIYKEGLQFYKAHQYSEAIEKFNGVLQINDRYANTHYNKALALKALGKVEEATESLQTALTLKPNNVLYLCSMGKLFAQENKKEEALDCFEKAHELSRTIDVDQTFTPRNADFVSRTLQGREQLLQKITELEKAAIKHRDSLDACKHQDHSIFHEAEQIFEKLSKAKFEILEEFEKSLDPQGYCDEEQYCDPAEPNLDLGASSEEVMQQFTAPEPHPTVQKNAARIRDLSTQNQLLLQKLQELQDQIATQNDALHSLSKTQEDIQDTVDDHDQTLDKQSENIARLSKVAKNLELDQQKMKQLVQNLQQKGVEDISYVLRSLSDLKGHLMGTPLDAEIEGDDYESSFFYTLKRDLIASQSAAMLVTHTDIIRNGKTGSIGNVGDILDIAGDVIPTFGGYAQFIGAILSTIDHNRQKEIVKKLADIATGPFEIEYIASNVARILSKNSYLDKSLIEAEETPLRVRIVDSLKTFLGEFADGNSSTTQESGKPHHHTQSKTSVFSCLPIFGRARTAVRMIEDEELDTSSQNSKNSLSFMSKKTKSKAAEESESVELSERELAGAADGHMISSIIVAAIYQGSVVAHFGDHKTIICKMLESVFVKLELDTESIPQILETELATMQSLEVMDITAAPAPISSEKQLSENIAHNILSEIRQQVTLPGDFDTAFIQAMTRRLNTYHSQQDSQDAIPNKVSLIHSMMESEQFKTTFVGVMVEKIVTKLKANSELQPTMRFLRNIIKETEEDLKEERDEFQLNKNPNETLVWCCEIAYNNPLLNDPSFTREATNKLTPDQFSYLLTMGQRNPQAAHSLYQNFKESGFDQAIKEVFGQTMSMLSHQSEGMLPAGELFIAEE